jgi:hypothetical protein
MLAVMKALFEDTSPAMEAALVARMRELGVADRAAQLVALNQASQRLALHRIRRCYPEAGARELALRLAALWIDRETMIRVFDWDPVHMGY